MPSGRPRCGRFLERRETIESGQRRATDTRRRKSLTPRGVDTERRRVCHALYLAALLLSSLTTSPSSAVTRTRSTSVHTGGLPRDKSAAGPRRLHNRGAAAERHRGAQRAEVLRGPWTALDVFTRAPGAGLPRTSGKTTDRRGPSTPRPRHTDCPLRGRAAATTEDARGQGDVMSFRPEGTSTKTRPERKVSRARARTLRSADQALPACVPGRPQRVHDPLVTGGSVSCGSEASKAERLPTVVPGRSSSRVPVLRDGGLGRDYPLTSRTAQAEARGDRFSVVSGMAVCVPVRRIAALEPVAMLGHERVRAWKLSDARARVPFPQLVRPRDSAFPEPNTSARAPSAAPSAMPSLTRNSRGTELVACSLLHDDKLRARADAHQ
jgi:hypothetical protein